MGRRVALVVATAGLLTAAVPVARAGTTTFGRPTAVSEYGQFIEFAQPAHASAEIARVEVLIDFPGGLGPLVTQVEPPRPNGGDVALDYRLLLADGHLLPNTTLTARWRVTDVDGAVEVGPAVEVAYTDTRFDWQTREGDLVRVHWYEGSTAFGERALQIGERAVRETSELLGVTEKDPIDFFVYADREAFYDALGPGTRESVGGQSNAEIRTMFGLITPSEIDADWVGIVIPHELTHLVFNTAVDNPYHFPPRWLNEGLAVYLSQGFVSSDRDAVDAAARGGTLIPLTGLGGQFPTTQDRFFLAYAESVASVDYLIRVHGRDALVSLIRSYARGLTDDEAFEGAIGVDVATFDAAWRASLDAKEPTEYGPQSAPPGPLPPGWAGADGSPAPTRGTGPGASSGPSAPGNPAPGGGSGFPVVGILAGIGLLVAAGVLGYLVAQRRDRLPPGTSAVGAAAPAGAVSPEPRPPEEEAPPAGPPADPPEEGAPPAGPPADPPAAGR